MRIRARHTLVPAAIVVTLAGCGLYAIGNLVMVTVVWPFDDIGAYLGAAQRLSDGATPYVTGPDPSTHYRYAPWFAYLWIPLLGIPRLPLEVAWAVVLLAATVVSVLPFRRGLAGIALGLLLGGLLYRTAGWANVQPVIVAALIYGGTTRAGPWLVGASASLKPWAILLVAAYVLRRDWWAVGISVGVAAALWLPTLLFDLGDYPVASRPPNLYDATLLLVVPGMSAWARSRERLRATAAGTGVGAVAP
jgi:hypothetical protein